MKNVLGCEGQCEVLLVADLLSKGVLIFEKKDILDRRPIHFRQPREIAPLIDTLPLEEEIVFYRIGDTQNDEYNLTCLSARKDKIKIVKVCTKPELEILIIINEGLYDEYLKQKSKMMPKQFVKTYVDGYTNFADYLENHDLQFAISEYKRLKKNEKGELFLADLIKK